MCKYCRNNINNKPIHCINKKTDKSKLRLTKTRFDGYTILAQIDNLADNTSFRVNYCPMCGRKLQSIKQTQ